MRQQVSAVCQQARAVVGKPRALLDDTPYAQSLKRPSENPRQGFQTASCQQTGSADDFHRPVVVAVVAVLVVQAAVDDVVDMVTVRHGFVAAACAVDVAAAGGDGVAAVGVGIVYFEDVLVVVAVVFVVQVAVVQVVDVIAVADGGVAAARAVDMVVVFVGLTVAHGVSFLLRNGLSMAAIIGAFAAIASVN